jgi:hypothetical protein
MSPENVGNILTLARAIGTNLWSATAGKKCAQAVNTLKYADLLK